MDKIRNTLNYLLIGMLKQQLNGINNANKINCIEYIIDIMSLFIDIDTFNWMVSLFNTIFNGLIYLLIHLIRRKYNKSIIDSLKYHNLIEYITTLQKLILPYSNIIKYNIIKCKRNKTVTKYK